MTLSVANNTVGLNNYYVEPKKTHSGKILGTAAGLGAGGLLTMSALQGWLKECAGKSHHVKGAHFVPLFALGLGVAALGIGIGSIVDNLVHKSRVKKAKKEAVELIQQNLSVQA